MHVHVTFPSLSMLLRRNLFLEVFGGFSWRLLMRLPDLRGNKLQEDKESVLFDVFHNQRYHITAVW